MYIFIFLFALHSCHLFSSAKADMHFFCFLGVSYAKRWCGSEEIHHLILWSRSYTYTYIYKVSPNLYYMARSAISSFLYLLGLIYTLPLPRLHFLTTPRSVSNHLLTPTIPSLTPWAIHVHTCSCKQHKGKKGGPQGKRKRKRMDRARRSEILKYQSVSWNMENPEGNK